MMIFLLHLTNKSGNDAKIKEKPKLTIVVKINNISLANAPILKLTKLLINKEILTHKVLIKLLNPLIKRIIPKIIRVIT